LEGLFECRIFKGSSDSFLSDWYVGGEEKSVSEGKVKSDVRKECKKGEDEGWG